jgi:trigger factor
LVAQERGGSAAALESARNRQISSGPYNGCVEAQVEELPDNKVRLTVEVPREDIHHAIEHAADDLAKAAKIPGFRKGKVPRPVLIQRVGKERLYTEAIESHIAGWFWNAAARTNVRPVEQPEYDFEVPETDDQPFAFTATVAVQAKPELADWTTLEVPYAEPEVPRELVQQELEALQATVAELAPVEGRPVQQHDTLVVDLVSPEGETRRDYVVELGRGAVVEELEDALVGLTAGETKSIEFELADGATQTVEATVKEIKEKVLPPLDDELAVAASEFETLDDLRGEIESRLRAQIEAEVDAAFREDVVDRLVEASRVEASGPLVETRTRTILNQLVRSVESRGISLDTYLTMTGTPPEQLVERLRGEAERSVARELVLEAAAEQLDVEVTDDEIRALLAEQGEDEETIAQFMESDALARIREDLRLRKALDRIAAEVKRVTPERDQIWTPDKEKPAVETKLWTPGSKEPA